MYGRERRTNERTTITEGVNTMAKQTSIDKSKLDGFISRYFLGGLGKSVVWNYDGKKLSTEFAAESRTMKGTVTFKSLGYPDAFKLGIFDTEKLMKVTSPLDTECELKVVIADGEAKSIDLSDGGSTAHFMLSSIDMIPQTPKAKELPKMDVGVKLTKELVERFIKGANALSDVGTFTVTVDKSSAKFTIGYTTVASNSIAVTAELDFSKAVSPITFPTPVFKEIFSANKDAKEMSLEFSEKGLAKIEFDSDDYKSTYYVVSTEEAK
jgi:hypothetical protein